jgi:hypothetical protein
LRHEGDVVLLSLSKETDEGFGDLEVRKLVITSNVVNLSDFSLVKDAVEGTGNVLYEEEVTGVASISMDGDRQITQKLVGQLGDELFWELVRSVHVVSTGDDAWELE